MRFIEDEWMDRIDTPGAFLYDGYCFAGRSCSMFGFGAGIVHSDARFLYVEHVYHWSKSSSVHNVDGME